MRRNKLNISAVVVFVVKERMSENSRLYINNSATVCENVSFFAANVSVLCSRFITAINSLDLKCVFFIFLLNITLTFYII